ncbi:MAG TPA: hypothetical protein PK373_04835, partial [Sedimentisphaerales bacterium]|nr:hypothetical protein [Sedimentisphaerales bacterium]
MLVRMPLPAVTWMGLLVASTVAVEVRTPDWLVTPIQTPATAVTSSDGKELVLSNGLIRRTFRLRPNAATVAYNNLMTGES